MTRKWPTLHTPRPPCPSPAPSKSSGLVHLGPLPSDDLGTRPRQDSRRGAGALMDKVAAWS